MKFKKKWLYFGVGLVFVWLPIVFIPGLLEQLGCSFVCNLLIQSGYSFFAGIISGIWFGCCLFKE